MSDTLKVEASKAPLPSKGKDVRKKWMTIGIVGMMIVLGWGILTGEKPKPRTTGDESLGKFGNTDIPKGGLDMTPKNIGQQSWQSQSQGEIRALTSKFGTMEAEQKALRTENGRLASQLNDARNGKGFGGATPPPPTPEGVASVRNTDILPGTILSGVPPAPLPSQAPRGPQGGISGAALPPIVVNPNPLEPPAAGAGRGTRPRTFDAPSSCNSTGTGSAGAGTIEAKVSYKKNEFSGFIPPGSWAEGVLLHGADLGGGAAVQSNPQPLLVMFKNHAQLPGSEHYRLKGCLIIVTGYADLSAERGILRGGRLSCIDKNEKLVLTAQVEVYVVDSDGKFGIRGKLVDRQGAKLAKALMAGFAQGIASMYGGSQGTLISSPLIGTSTTIQGSEALKSAGLQGASQAATQLAQFYLQQAQAIYPVLEVEAERKVNIVFSNGAQLVWKSMVDSFETEVTPQAAPGTSTIVQPGNQVVAAPQQPNQPQSGFGPQGRTN